MKHEEMVALVAGETGLTRDAAEESIVATLNVLAERVTSDEMRDLLAQLPKALQAGVQIPRNPRASHSTSSSLESTGSPPAMVARAARRVCEHRSPC